MVKNEVFTPVVTLLWSSGSRFYGLLGKLAENIYLFITQIFTFPFIMQSASVMISQLSSHYTSRCADAITIGTEHESSVLKSVGTVT